MSEGFLGRWSRRKQEVRAGETPVEDKVSAAVPKTIAPAPEAVTEAPAADAPPLTLADVEQLGVESDYKPFLAREVAPEVKNAAFRKLFSDPHFNVMDGLDIYVDDYSKSTPIPDSVLRQMASAKFLKLFDEAPEDLPPETPTTVGTTPVAQSTDTPTLPSQPVADTPPASQEIDDNHADLRLQPDDAARAEATRRGAG